MSDRLQEIRDAFVEARGYWNPNVESLLQADPEFFETYLNLSAVPWRTGELEPKVKEFIYIALAGAATHLWAPGLKSHIGKAKQFGATKEEILEVLQLTSTLGIHAANIGVPLLIQSLKEAGKWEEPPQDERRAQLKEEFTRNRGYWHEFWDGVLALDPDFFEAYTDFSSHPWKHGVLEPKVKELIYCAFDVSATHLYVPGLKLHIENAIGYGATARELMEVIELASVIGVHTMILGVPMVLETFADETAPVS